MNKPNTVKAQILVRNLNWQKLVKWTNCQIKYVDMVVACYQFLGFTKINSTNTDATKEVPNLMPTNIVLSKYTFPKISDITKGWNSRLLTHTPL